MSTRAIISITDEMLYSFNIYVNWDASPAKILLSIEKAMEFAWKFPRFEAWDFTTALIKVLKKEAWWVYLINAIEKLSEIDYYYQISKENWDLKIKTTDFNSKIKFL